MQVVDRITAVVAAVTAILLPWLVDHGVIDATVAGIIGSAIGAAVTAWHGGSYIQGKVGNSNNSTGGQQ